MPKQFVALMPPSFDRKADSHLEFLVEISRKIKLWGSAEVVVGKPGSDILPIRFLRNPMRPHQPSRCVDAYSLVSVGMVKIFLSYYCN